ncbi:MAG: DNA/pantothenate metabolism flavoprotein domain protein [Verrucomicrobiae bacterium]|nr:DNA/pantothenate metabolism flavoprotein domain protein [Verrucomicrobiae bacterium]
MNIVVTCGPAHEPIDEVRRITNFSTGRLGIGLANHLASLGHAVTCLVGHHATHRGEIRASRTETFTTAESLARALEAIARGPGANAVFHAAAVSDFVVARAEDTVGQTLERAKIPSGAGEIRLVLKPAPKILPRLRDWFPGAFLVGWKYELDDGRDAAIARAASQVARCRTDLCVLNGRAFGPGFGLCDASGLIASARGHHDLFDSLARRLPPESP